MEENFFKCTRFGHKETFISQCCLKQNCNKNRKICSFCMGDHYDHISDCFQLSFLEKLFLNEESKLNRVLQNFLNKINLSTYEKDILVNIISSYLNDLAILKNQFREKDFSQFDEILRASIKCYSNIFYLELKDVIFQLMLSDDKILERKSILKQLDDIYNEEDLDYLIMLLLQKGCKRKFILGISLLSVLKFQDALKLFETILSVKPIQEAIEYRSIDSGYLGLTLAKLEKKQQDIEMIAELKRFKQQFWFKEIKSSDEYYLFFLALIKYDKMQYRESQHLLGQLEEDYISNHILGPMIRQLMITNLFYLKQYDDALHQCQLGLLKNQQDQKLRFLESFCLIEKNKFALELVQSETSQSDSQFYQEHHSIKFQDIENDAVITWLIKIVKCNSKQNVLNYLAQIPNDKIFQIIRCIILFHLGFYNEVLDYIYKNLSAWKYREFSSEQDILQNMRVILLTLTGKIDEALYVVMIIQQSNQVDFYWRLLQAKVLFYTGQVQQSIDYYQVLCLQKYQRFECHFDLGYILLLNKKFEQALQSFEKVLSINPNFTPAIYYKGMILIQLNNDEEALNTFRAIINFQRSKLYYSSNQNKLVQLLIKNKQVTQAFAVIQQNLVSQKYTNRLQILKCQKNKLFIDQTLMAMKEYHQAYETIKNVKKKKLKSFLWFLVKPLIKANELEKAQQLIDSEISHGGDNFYIYATQGELLRKQRKFAEAISSYIKSFSNQQSSPLKEMSTLFYHQKLINQ